MLTKKETQPTRTAINFPMQHANPTSKVLTFATRFGDVEVREDRLLTFPKGLFGFDNCSVFGLARIPGAEESALMLLQCVDNPEIAFIVADPSMLGLNITAADKSQALRDTKMPVADTQMLVILTMYDQGDSYYMTANLRAPILIDSQNRVGTQHILLNKDYSTQHKI